MTLGLDLLNWLVTPVEPGSILTVIQWCQSRGAGADNIIIFYIGVRVDAVYCDTEIQDQWEGRRFESLLGQLWDVDQTVAPQEITV